MNLQAEGLQNLILGLSHNWISKSKLPILTLGAYLWKFSLYFGPAGEYLSDVEKPLPKKHQDHLGKDVPDHALIPIGAKTVDGVGLVGIVNF